MPAQDPGEVAKIEASSHYQRLHLIEQEIVGMPEIADAAFPAMVHYLAIVRLTHTNQARTQHNVRQAICWAIDIVEAGIDVGEAASGEMGVIDGAAILRHVATKALAELGE